MLSVKNARDLVTQSVGNAYLQIIAMLPASLPTQYEIDADNAVYVNASRRHDAGTAIAIDVLRSQVELKQRQQMLVAQSNQTGQGQAYSRAYRRSRDRPGLHGLGSRASVPLAAMTLKDALAKAYDNRPEFSGRPNPASTQLALCSVPPRPSAIRLSRQQAPTATKVCISFPILTVFPNDRVCAVQHLRWRQNQGRTFWKITLRCATAAMRWKIFADKLTTKCGARF